MKDDPSKTALVSFFSPKDKARPRLGLNEAFQVPFPESQVGTVNDIDKFVGRHLRFRRLELCIGLEEFSTRLRLTTAALTAIERGEQRLGAKLLLEASIVLDVPISYFFDGLTAPDSVPRIQ